MQALKLAAAGALGGLPPEDELLHAAESSARTLSAATVLAVPFTDTSSAGGLLPPKRRRP